MNKEYTYIDGKVIISDENDNKTQSDYYDNLDEVLAQENLIETMEEKIQVLEKKIQLYKKNNKKRYVPIIFPMVALVSTIGAPIMFNFLTATNSFTTYVDTIFGTISQALFISIPLSICFIPVGAGLELSMYKDYKNSLKREKGINSELGYLKQQIEKEKEYLESLKQERTRNKEKTNFRTVKVDDLQQLKALKSYLDLYFDLGYNGEKYYKYFQEGQLDTKLQKYYTDTGIQLAKEYIEEKGHSLVLIKKSNNIQNPQK